MISDARGGHVSPGIYTEERDVAYAVKSLGITSLGVAGETLYGPAFEPIEVADWSEFTTYFGGTSTEKFRDTDLPKYELPYVAKSYLEQSRRLNVVRILGLSGYKAGPVYTVIDSNTKKVAAVLRSKMVYGYPETGDDCGETREECLKMVDSVSIGNYSEVVYDAQCNAVAVSGSGATPYKFSITVTTTADAQKIGYDETYFYNVSLRPSDPDYIYNVIGSDPNHSNTPVYIEAVFENNVNENTSFSAVTSNGQIDYQLPEITMYYKLSEMVQSGTTTGETPAPLYTFIYNEVPGDTIPSSMNVTNATESGNGFVVANLFAEVDSETGNTSVCVYNGNTDTAHTPTYIYRKYENLKIDDYYDNFKEMYRPAQTPWFVSNIDANAIDGKCTMHKLFKFITISDGNAANYQVKVSITNIDPSNGTFDILIRDYNDSDTNPLVLEKFSRCNLVEGTEGYIARKIGTPDGSYPSKSKFVTVKMAEGVDMANAVPAGFIGYPMPTYSDKVDSTTTVRPTVEYNVRLDTSKKPRRQYFGMTSQLLDQDVLSYKGYYAYDSYGDANPTMISNGFHMDSIIEAGNYTSATTYVDGVSGYVFTCVDPDKVGSETKIPRIVKSQNYMRNTIYSDVTTRKFTAYFYGGFDGWDENRYSRTNTDDYKATRYNVLPASSATGSTSGMVFTRVTDNGLNNTLNLPDTAITSDYYAYLAGYMAFADPQETDINVFATPGIDWYNNRLLTEDAIDMLVDNEDGRGGDALYIVNSPRDLDYSDAIYELDETGIDSSYAATYYPWVSYYDSFENRYIDLPVTKDVVRNLALTDNTTAPWFASAGVTRGKVDCYRPLHKTTLTEEDALYENRINPVKFFAKDGVLLWGNKTMYTGDTPLNRINVRRLMIRIKKLVVDASRSLIFEQADDMVEKQFRGIVDPILANVKSNRGIYDYRIVTENTEETRDQHILPAKILVKPTPTLEYISISFVVYPESVKFDE